MTEQSLKFYRSAKSLLRYINEEQVYDKMGDAGCGGVDPHQSEKFYNLIVAANAALRELEEAMPEELSKD